MNKPFEKNFGIITQHDFLKLRNIRVLIVGLGGLGGHIANNLVRLGVMSIDMCDHDAFEITNLNRQLFSSHATIGQYKVDVVKASLLAINPDINVNIDAVRVQELDDHVFDNIDLMIDAVDDIATKLYLEHVACKHGKPLLHGAVAGWYGQIGLVMPESYLLQELYQGKHQGLERTLGSPTFTPAVVASMMTCEFVKYIMGHEQALINKIMMIDLLNHDYRVLLEHQPEKSVRKEKRSW